MNYTDLFASQKLFLEGVGILKEPYTQKMPIYYGHQTTTILARFSIVEVTGIISVGAGALVYKFKRMPCKADETTYADDKFISIDPDNNYNRAELHKAIKNRWYNDPLLIWDSLEKAEHWIDLMGKALNEPKTHA